MPAQPQTDQPKRTIIRDDEVLRTRWATEADFAAMTALLSETFEQTWRPVITPAAACRYLDEDVGGVFVREHGREMMLAEIGCVLVGFAYWRDDFIAAVHVATSAQGRGVGRTLMAAAEREIAAAGFKSARLETDTFNARACAVYRALGYVEKDRYPDDEWDSGFTTVLFEKAFDRDVAG